MSFAALPAELCPLIAEHAASASDVAAFIETCKACYLSAVHVLYRHVALPASPQIEAFCEYHGDENERSSVLLSNVRIFEFGEWEMGAYRPDEDLVWLMRNAIYLMSSLEKFLCFWRSTDPRPLAALASCSSTLHTMTLCYPGPHDFDFYGAPYDAFQYGIEIPHLPRLRTLVILDYNEEEEQFQELVYEVIVSCSETLRNLTLGSQFAAENFEAGTWTNLRHLETNDIAIHFVPDILSRLERLTSICIRSGYRSQDAMILARGHSGTQYLPNIKTVDCTARYLPLFFPSPSGPKPLSFERQVTSLTVVDSKWADCVAHLPNSVAVSPLAISLIDVRFDIEVFDLNVLAEFLRTLPNLESIVLALGWEKELSYTFLDNLVAGGAAILANNRNLDYFAINERDSEDENFRYADDVDLQRQWLAEWDRLCPEHSLTQVEFTNAWAWIRKEQGTDDGDDLWEVVCQ